MMISMETTTVIIIPATGSHKCDGINDGQFHISSGDSEEEIPEYRAENDETPRILALGDDHIAVFTQI